jgi:hypothetical protein
VADFDRPRIGYPHRPFLRSQKDVLATDLGYDDGGRHVLLAISGGEIGHPSERFGTVFSVIDSETGVEVDGSLAVPARRVREERRKWLGVVMHLNGREDGYAG